jgi:hypothetical protein
MKREMTDYLNSMSDADLSILENIICLQYVKFIHFYRLIEAYSDKINNVKYNFISPLSLDVVLVFKKASNLKSIKTELESSMSDSEYEGSIDISKKEMNISIILNEDED